MVLILHNVEDPRKPCGGAESPGHYNGALATSLGFAHQTVTRTQALTNFAQTRNGLAIAYEIVFSPPHSWSIMWGLSESDTVQLMEKAYSAAIDRTMKYVEEQLSYTRRGPNGVRQIDASLLWAQFEHFSDRRERPDRHTHVVIDTTVRGSDEHWGQLDVRPLRNNAEAGTFQAIFESAIAAHSSQMVGLAFEERAAFEPGEKTRFEVAGVPDELITNFFGRSVSSWQESDWQVL
ncbi:MobF family relaxase [Nocardia bovistercoris]|uniref:Relaxase domain-containing protein n=1 Tax=Nocardia bovistercoris TaxID=2785916 RepID=A0A931I812_9NOCA|nr:MobF family relaxase [Nocardia bovistercoris]MBH0775603.1 relaxase domain-containing protein [Nocardia bovistercoris]